MAASSHPADPRSAHEAHARIRAIQQRQEQAARQRVQQPADLEATEAAVRAQREIATLQARLRELQDENDALHDQIALLMEAGGQPGNVPYEWGLSRQEACLLAAIRQVGAQILTTEAALVVLYRDEAGVRSRGTPAVLISRIRRKLAARSINLVIETHEQRGYRLSPASIALFDAALTGAPSRNGAEG